MLNSDSIGLKIKTIREQKQISQDKVVEQLIKNGININKEILNSIENGERILSAYELDTLCKILDININKLFTEEEDLISSLKKNNFSEKTVQEVENLYDMIKLFISQKKIYNKEYIPNQNKPLWK